MPQQQGPAGLGRWVGRAVAGASPGPGAEGSRPAPPPAQRHPGPGLGIWTPWIFPLREARARASRPERGRDCDPRRRRCCTVHMKHLCCNILPWRCCYLFLLGCSSDFVRATSKSRPSGWCNRIANRQSVSLPTLVNRLLYPRRDKLIVCDLPFLQAPWARKSVPWRSGPSTT